MLRGQLLELLGYVVPRVGFATGVCEGNWGMFVGLGLQSGLKGFINPGLNPKPHRVANGAHKGILTAGTVSSRNDQL